MAKEEKSYPDFRMLEFRAEDVLFILQLLEERSLFAVLDGGWGVDALVGQQTRKHSDLDILVLENELEQVVQALKMEGFACIEHETELPNRYVMYCEETELFIDMHPLKTTPNGDFLHDMIKFEFTYSKESVAGIGHINGQQVRCITADQQLKCRLNKDYDRNDPDRLRPGGLNADTHDLTLLQKK